MTHPHLSVVVPVFNERDNVTPLINEITAALRGLGAQNRYDAAGTGRRMRGWTAPSTGPNKAIAEKADALERRQAFHEEARERLAEMEASGMGIEWEDMERYLRARMAGEDVPLPASKPIRG